MSLTPMRELHDIGKIVKQCLWLKFARQHARREFYFLGSFYR